MTEPAVLERPVARKKAVEKQGDTSVRIRTDVLEEVRIAAAFCGMSISDYLSDRIRPIARRDIEEGHKRFADNQKKPR